MSVRVCACVCVRAFMLCATDVRVRGNTGKTGAALGLGGFLAFSERAWLKGGGGGGGF